MIKVILVFTFLIISLICFILYKALKVIEEEEKKYLNDETLKSTIKK